MQKIASEATEQSGGNIIPEISLEEIWEYDLRDTMALHPWELNHDISSVWKASSYTLLVGPEGGFSDDEIQKFTQKWARAYYLWDRILRLETVPIVLGFYLNHLPE